MKKSQQVSREVILKDARCFAAFAMAKSGQCPSFRAMARRILPLLGEASNVFPHCPADLHTQWFKYSVFLHKVFEYSSYTLLLSSFAFWIRRTINYKYIIYFYWFFFHSMALFFSTFLLLSARSAESPWWPPPLLDKSRLSGGAYGWQGGSVAVETFPVGSRVLQKSLGSFVASAKYCRTKRWT